MRTGIQDLALASQVAAGVTTPAQWPWALSSPPVACSETTGWTGALVRRWSGTSPVMEQPPLDQHYIVMHLGGAKHVARRGDSAPVSTIVESGSFTLVPAGTAYRWRTSGPIAFAHLYLRPQQLEDVVSSVFDLDGRGTSLVERVGFRDQLLQPLFGRMLREIEQPSISSTLLLDSLLESLLIRIVQKYASHGIAERFRPVSLAPHRLQRVLEFVEANLDQDVTLADLVAAAGTSQYHFSHAFRIATGCAPYRYLVGRRVEYAKVLLLTGSASLNEVSASCGFKSRHQLGVMFKRIVGVGPKRYQMALRPLDVRQ